jgi:hypothetical protein
MTQTTLVRPSFEQMVKDLFKLSVGHGAPMMHAAIGIIGESGELRTCSSRKDIVEESGDLEFYVEAAWQQVKYATRETYFQSYANDNLLLHCGEITLGNVLDKIHVSSSLVLNHAKKIWVYEDGSRDADIVIHLCHIEVFLLSLYEMIGITRQEIRTANQDKLLGNEKIRGRYMTGVYSNEQALARADKVEAESCAASRSFIGQKKV